MDRFPLRCGLALFALFALAAAGWVESIRAAYLPTTFSPAGDGMAGMGSVPVQKAPPAPVAPNYGHSDLTPCEGLCGTGAGSPGGSGGGSPPPATLGTIGIAIPAPPRGILPVEADWGYDHLAISFTLDPPRD